MFFSSYIDVVYVADDINTKLKKFEALGIFLILKLTIIPFQLLLNHQVNVLTLKKIYLADSSIK